MTQGFALTESDFLRVARAVEWVESYSRLHGDGSRPVGVEPDIARVTSGTADGAGTYPGVITYWDGSAWQDYAVTVRVKPINGEALSSGTRYPVRPIGESSGTPLYAVLGALGGGSSSLTVREADGAPSVGSVTTITTNQAQGLTTTSGGAGTAALSIADAATAQVGVVNLSTTSQMMGTGPKLFGGTADPIVVDGYSTYRTVKVNATVGTGGGATAVFAELGVKGGSTETNATAYVGGGQGSLVGQVWVSFDTTNNRAWFAGDSGSSTRPGSSSYAGTPTFYSPRFGCLESSTTFTNGGTATTGGLTFKGGLYISGTATGIGGGGTVGTVPLFDGTGTIADSGITDDGTTTGFTRAVALDTTHISGGAVLADIDNQDPSGSSVLFFDLSSASISLTGVQGGTDGRIVKLFNTSGSKNLTLKHDTTSTAANRFYTPGAADYVIGPYGSAEIVYNGTQSRWLVMDKA